MKAFLTVIGVMGVGALMFAGCAIGTYNGLAQGNQACEASWSQVENVYQRRADLVPNIVATVKGYMSHEADVLKSVAAAQASVGKVTIDPKNMTPQQLEQFSSAQATLGGALQKLMVVSYQNPNLKADQGFNDLRATLEGSENRIAVERKKFNEAVQDFNNRTVSFPSNLMAGWFGFKARPFFKAEEGSHKAPKVDF